MLHLAASALVLAAAAAGAAGPRVVVRASPVLAPCVAASAAAYPRGGVRLEGPRPGAVDVLVLPEIEMTRALENGSAEDGTEKDVARIPWVLAASGAGDPGAKAGALASGAAVVAIPKGAASYEARRWLESAHARRVVELDDPQALRDARDALLPLSLAQGRPAVPAADVPDLVARVALAAGRPSDAARAFAAWLASQDGQRAFASCGSPAR